MIDLRSDTLTIPDRSMLETILTAPLGDDGRLDAEGRGEDPTVNKLEDMSAALVGKQAGLLCTSGTMGNQAAVLTWCRPGDTVLVNDLQHLDRSEKTAFDPRFGQMKKAVYHLDENFQPATEEIEDQFRTGSIKLLCLENTHNYTGGTCITEASLKKIYDLAQKYYIPVHMDGARLFNAALYLKVPRQPALSVRRFCAILFFQRSGSACWLRTVRKQRVHQSCQRDPKTNGWRHAPGRDHCSSRHLCPGT